MNDPSLQGPKPAPPSTGLYDAHAHLVASDTVRYPHNPIPRTPMPPRDPSKPPPPSSVYDKGVIGRPGGFHGPNPVNEKPTAEQMHQWMAEEGVVGMAAVQKARIYGTDNSYIVDAADLFPGEMRAVIVVDPQAPETLDMIRGYHKRGIVGVRFFGASVVNKIAWLNSPESAKVWELCAELGLPIDIEAPGQDSDALIPIITDFVDRLPTLKVVLDHVYLPEVTEPLYGIDERFDAFKKRDRIYVKFTCINMDISRELGVAPEEVFRRTVDYYGADRVMWGTDIGTSSGTYKEMVMRALYSTKLLNDEERRKVLHDTGRRFFTGWNG